MSILSLNYDCLLEILSHVDDFTSFYCFSHTCKRFYQASLETQSWHVNVVKRKIRYYGTKFVISEYPKDRKYSINLPMIDDLVQIAEIYKITKPTSMNVMNVWKARGPVAAEMFKWIVDFKLRHESNRDGEIQRIVKKLIFHLPLRKQEFIIDTHFNVSSNKLTLKVTCGDLFVLYEILQSSKTQCSYSNLSKEQLRGFEVRAKPVIEIVQEELGETIPSFTGYFLLWFCFYPQSLQERIDNALESKEKLAFRNSDKNVEPTQEGQESTTQTVDTDCESESLMKQIGESTNVVAVSKMVECMNESSKQKILHSLSKDIFFVLGDLQQLRKISHLSEDMICSLVLRVNFLPNTFSDSHESDVTNFNFRTKDGEILKIEKVGLPFGKFRSVWNFTLPNGQTVHFEMEEFSRWMNPREFGEVHDPFMKLQPITDVLEDCVNNDLDDKEIRLTNLFTERLFTACLFYKHCDKLYSLYGS